MGRPSRSEANEWALAIVHAIEELRQRNGLTNEELISSSGISRNYYYVRMRGDIAWDANDQERLAKALHVHPHEISRLAAIHSSGDDDVVAVADRAALADRLSRLAASPLASGEDFNDSVLLALLTERGIAASAEEWQQYLDPASETPIRRRVLEVVADYAGFPRTYLTDSADEEAREAAEAVIDFRQALRASGADSLSSRVVGEISPTALRAIAQVLRSIDPS